MMYTVIWDQKGHSFMFWVHTADNFTQEKCCNGPSAESASHGICLHWFPPGSDWLSMHKLPINNRSFYRCQSHSSIVHPFKTILEDSHQRGNTIWIGNWGKGFECKLSHWVCWGKEVINYSLTPSRRPKEWFHCTFLNMLRMLAYERKHWSRHILAAIVHAHNNINLYVTWHPQYILNTCLCSEEKLGYQLIWSLASLSMVHQPHLTVIALDSERT